MHTQIAASTASAASGTSAPRRIRLRRAALALPLAGALLPVLSGPLAAQTALGVPFIGANHLSFYSTELSRDGVATTTSTLYGGRYGRRFGDAMEPSSVALVVQVAGRSLDGPTDGVLDASLTTSWSRRMDEVTNRLSVSAAAGASLLGWGLSNDEIGLAHVSLPLTVGAAYDVRIGSATFSPFVAPALAWSSTRHYQNDERVATDTGWDARWSGGASLRFRDMVLTAGGIHGERGLPNRSRWTFAAGMSF